MRGRVFTHLTREKQFLLEVLKIPFLSLETIHKIKKRVGRLDKRIDKFIEVTNGVVCPK